MIKPVLHAFLLAVVSITLVSLKSTAQLSLLKKQNVNGISGIKADPLGNYYLYNRSAIFKYNLSDTLFSRYSELQYGSLSGLDVSNPMKLTLHYAEVSMVVFLDNTLNPTFTPTNLYEVGLETAILVCSSYDNGFWAFDAPSFSLSRINSFGEVDRKVKNINLITGLDIHPTQMLEKENQLYLYDPAAGIFLFDIFGGYLKKWPLTGFQTFSVDRKQLYYCKNNKLYQFDTKLFKENEMNLPVDDVLDTLVEKDRLYILSQSGNLFIFKLG